MTLSTDMKTKSERLQEQCIYYVNDRCCHAIAQQEQLAGHCCECEHFQKSIKIRSNKEDQK